MDDTNTVFEEDMSEGDMSEEDTSGERLLIRHIEQTFNLRLDACHHQSNSSEGQGRHEAHIPGINRRLDEEQIKTCYESLSGLLPMHSELFACYVVRLV